MRLLREAPADAHAGSGKQFMATCIRKAQRGAPPGSPCLRCSHESKDQGLHEVQQEDRSKEEEEQLRHAKRLMAELEEERQRQRRKRSRKTDDAAKLAAATALIEGQVGTSSPTPLPLPFLTAQRSVAWRWPGEKGGWSYMVGIGCSSHPLVPPFPASSPPGDRRAPPRRSLEAEAGLLAPTCAADPLLLATAGRVGAVSYKRTAEKFNRSSCESDFEKWQSSTQKSRSQCLGLHQSSGGRVQVSSHRGGCPQCRAGG
eukprot:s1198_g7.t1